MLPFLMTRLLIIFVLAIFILSVGRLLNPAFGETPTLDERKINTEHKVI